MKSLFVTLGLVSVLTLGGCATFTSKIEGSKEFQKFCVWSGVAQAAVQAAALESSKDPSKQTVTEALMQTVALLSVASAQCPASTP